MKYLYFILFFTICFNVLKAQKRKFTNEQKAAYYTQQLVDSLNISEKQRLQAFEVNFMVSNSMDSLYKNIGDDKQRRRAMVDVFKKRDSLFRTILTNEQFLRFDDMEREKREQKKKKKE